MWDTRAPAAASGWPLCQAHESLTLFVIKVTKYSTNNDTETFPAQRSGRVGSRWPRQTYPCPVHPPLPAGPLAPELPPVGPRHLITDYEQYDRSGIY